MEINKLKTNKGNIINEVLLIKPDIFSDERGYFYESWNLNTFNEKICERNFYQDNHSKSIKGVLRGIHYQINPYPQGKLVRCVRGKIFDLAIDLRKKSKTYREWISFELSDENKNLLWIPEGFGHAFLTLSDFAEVQYKVTKIWNNKYEKSLLWNDPNLDIKWPLDKLENKKPIVSQKDCVGLNIIEAEKLGYIF